MGTKQRLEPVLRYPRHRQLRPETGSAHRAALKTRITGRSATAAETRDLEPKSHRKASTWPAYSAPQNHLTTHHPKMHHPKTTHPPAGKTRRRRRRARRVRRTRKPKTKTTKRPNRSKQNLSNRRRLSRQRVLRPATISDPRSPLSC